MLKLSSTSPSESAVLPDAQRAVATSTRAAPSAAPGALVEAYRAHGYRRAAIDPLDSEPRERSLIAELDPRTYGLPIDESIAYSLDFAGGTHVLTLSALLGRLREAYCGSVAIDCAHVRANEQRRWLHARMETRSGWPDPSGADCVRVLGQLVAAEAFEQLHRADYGAYKQFSLEGSESIVTLLRETIESAAGHGVQTIVLGMPHRGRLNMMLNALDVPAHRVLSLFSASPDLALAARDLKDHAGLTGRMRTASGEIAILLAHNPSHLESVSPVVCGMARALQDRQTDASSRRVMPILMHGDASFSAQGIVTETLNLSQTRGYGVGGTMHLILNNQIGSTVSHPRDSRSTLSCADVARAVDAPIVHVNADDPDAVVFAARLASGFRATFGADIVIDHVGYRRHGHFFRDDPTITQPAMQRRIRRHRSVVSLYAEQLSRRGIAGEELAATLGAEAMAAMKAPPPDSAVATPPATGVPSQTPASKPVRTTIPLGQLRAMIERLATAPQGFGQHAELSRMLDDWRLVARDDDRPVDWRLAENLAYCSLLANGFNVRLSGLDVGRGTFVHRQHVWHHQDADTDWQDLHVPLRHVAEGQGIFSIFESPLSEEAVVGFEYGYSLKCGRDLVVWEAQFGDFVNNAQVIIDQYIASGEAKWGYESGLVLLLPHGHDGWGPEHSCAFLGRFLQLCAAGNMHVAMPSTAVQMFHLLRRQALTDRRQPLVVMTPKPWLYGVRPSYSPLSKLANDQFHPLLTEDRDADRGAVSRVIVTSGKLYYDLADERERLGLRDLPILRAEQLHPFPADALAIELQQFPQLTHVIWAQEEARNHGAWHLVRDRLESALPPGVMLHYAGRAESASTAAGSAALHAVEQRQIVAAALEVPTP
jgi:2-oxoglutarate dehydrogenase E1 component